MKTASNSPKPKPCADWRIFKLGVVAETTDYVANGSFASLKHNVKYRSEPNYAVLVRLTDFTKRWSGKYVYVDESAFEFLRKSSLSPGDVVVANVGDPGRVFRVPDLGQPMTLGPNAVLIRPRSDLDRGFLANFLSSPQGQALIAGITTGTAQKKFNKTSLRQLDVPVPELSEQREIVAEIEKQFTRLEAGVAGLRRVQANLKRYRAAVLKSACEGKLIPTEAELARQEGRTYETGAQLLERILSERRQKWNGRRKYKDPLAISFDGLPALPDGWAYTQMDALLSSERVGMKTGPFGTLLKKSDQRVNGIPVLGIENIERMKFSRGSKVHITREKWSALKGYSVEPEDILISRSGTVGEVCVVPVELGPAIISTNLLRLSLHSYSLLAMFFCFLFNGSPIVLGQVQELCKGSTRNFLNQHILRSLVFPLPPLAEQQRIVAEVERRLSVVEEQEAAVNANLQRASRLRQSILQKSFTACL